MSARRESARVYARRRLLLLAGLACVVGLALLALGQLRTGDADAVDAPSGVAVEAPLSPASGVASTGALLIGAAPQGESGDPGEAWATMARDAAGVLPGALGAAAGPKLMRYTGAEGWRYVDAPVDEQGQPFATDSAPAVARVTPRGVVVWVLEDSNRPEGEQRFVFVRERGGRLQAISRPDPRLLLEPDGPVPGEQIAPTALAARDAGERTELFVPIGGRPLQTGVLRWNAGTWSREPICVADARGEAPDACAPEETLTDSGTALTTIALDAVAGGDAWLLARAHANARRGIVLFRRIEADDASRWVLHELPAPFRDVEDLDRALRSVAPRESPAALTAVADGVWIDGSFTLNGAAGDVTLRLAGSAVTSWCDGDDAFGQPLCDRPLGFRMRADTRSVAWAGAGHGERVLYPIARNGEPDTTALARLQADGSYDTEMVLTGNGPTGLALASPDEGWRGGLRVTRTPSPSRIADWPLPARRPLTSVVSAPGATPGDPGAPALAVGLAGTIVRYAPGHGWDREALISDGGVATPNLRGVAWPEPDFAYAVGDEGAMWRWRAATNLWERDPAAPFDFVDYLTDVAFQPGSSTRGYAVGRAGALLRYDKSWTREPLPPEAAASGPRGGPADVFDVAFAGSQALAAAGRRLLVNDGAGWRVDPDAEALGGDFFAVAGLPDGGAVAAGRGVVIVRDAAGAPWRRVEQPLPRDAAVVTAAATRDGDHVRPIVSLTTRSFPWSEDMLWEAIDPSTPPPRLPGFATALSGTLLRETAAGWHDEGRRTFDAPAADKPRTGDPVLALALDPSGRGWLAGGWAGQYTTEERVNLRAQTAAIQHYAPAGDPARAPGQTESAVPLAAGPVRFAVGGGARCESWHCDEIAVGELMPDRTLAAAVTRAARLAQAPGGPRALLYTGGHTAATGRAETDAEAGRQAQLLGGASSLSVFSAVASSNSGARTTEAFQRAFAGFAAPFGEGPAASGGIGPAAIENAGTPQPGRARTHYAFDSNGPEGAVRVIVIDNAAGSLAAADPMQNPVEPSGQAAWLRSALEDARARGIPAVVMGSRSLSAAEQGRASAMLPDPNVAEDANEVAAILAEGGASAYVYESPERQTASAIPDGVGTVPSFGTGTLGYRGRETQEGYDPPGLLLLELDASRRDPATNRAPASVRLVPVIDELAIDAVDGRVLNRSQPALFRGLGRRPRSGDRYSRGGNPQSSAYVDLPGPTCPDGCPGRVDPEVRFFSTDPDIADFVRVDPTSTDPRKPFIDPASDKVVADSGSGLLCAFNAGTTTVRIESGGLAYSTTVTVRGGSALRPCGTMPLSERNLPRMAAPPSAAVPPPPPSSPPVEADPRVDVPPPPVARPEPVERPVPVVEQPPPPVEPAPRPAPRPVVVERPDPPSPNPPPFLPTQPALPGLLPLQPPPPPPSVGRPIPPSGTAPVSVNVTVASPVAQVQREREEEEALEQSQAYVRVVAADHEPGRAALPVLALILVAAGAGAALRRPRRGERHSYAFARGGARRAPAAGSARPRVHDHERSRRLL